MRTLICFGGQDLKAGICILSPGSIVRHHHCGTGVEWSPSFTYYVLRNRVLSIFKCGWFTLFIRSYFAFLAAAVIALAGCLRLILTGRRCSRPDIPIRARIIFEFFYLLPINIFTRLKIRRSRKVADSGIKKWAIEF